jgi:tryptophan-rich sensory protein
MKSKKEQFFWLMFFAALVLLTSVVGGLFTTTSVNNWYEGLEKPAYTPASWVFGPVWAFLYAMTALAGWLFWRKCGFAKVWWVWVFYFLQLVLNAGWSFVFFYLQSPGGGLLELSILWGVIVIMLIGFISNARGVSVLLIPYFIWVSFAWLLNYGIWRLN